MAQVPGIKIEKDAKGNPRYARFDLRKHREAIEPYLNSIGAITDKYKDKNVSYISADELKLRLHKHIDTLPWKE